MAAVKVTFSLDADTVARLRQAADRLNLPQSQVVREAVAEYADRIGRLGEAERATLLRTFDRLVPLVPSRSARAVDAEIEELRASRRAGGRRQRALNPRDFSDVPRLPLLPARFRQP